MHAISPQSLKDEVGVDNMNARTHTRTHARTQTHTNRPQLLKEELGVDNVNARRTLVQAVCREIEGLGCLGPPSSQALVAVRGSGWGDGGGESQFASGSGGRSLLGMFVGVRSLYACVGVHVRERQSSRASEACVCVCVNVLYTYTHTYMYKRM